MPSSLLFLYPSQLVFPLYPRTAQSRYVSLISVGFLRGSESRTHKRCMEELRLPAGPGEDVRLLLSPWLSPGCLPSCLFLREFGGSYLLQEAFWIAGKPAFPLISTVICEGGIMPPLQRRKQGQRSNVTPPGTEGGSELNLRPECKV